MSLLAAAIGTKVFGAFGKRRAGKQMEALAKQQAMMAQQNAALERRELAESIRRQEFKNIQTSGSALSKASASGVTLEGSTQGYLDFMDTELAGQVDWMQAAGESRIKQNLNANLLQAKSTKLNAKSMKTSALTDLAGAFGMATGGGLFGSNGGYNAGSSYKDVNIPLTSQEKTSLFN